MKWCAIFSPTFNEYTLYHLIEWRLLIVFIAFMPVYFFLHIFYHGIPHFIHIMENRRIRVSHSKHLINRSCESQNICNLVPPQIIQNIIPHRIYATQFGLMLFLFFIIIIFFYAIHQTSLALVSICI